MSSVSEGGLLAFFCFVFSFVRHLVNQNEVILLNLKLEW